MEVHRFHEPVTVDFTTPATGDVMVTATRSNAALAALLQLEAVDVFGNQVTCESSVRRARRRPRHAAGAAKASNTTGTEATDAKPPKPPSGENRRFVAS